MQKEAIKTDNAPSAIGPYSQAVKVGNTIYISGQLPINPDTGSFTGPDIASQTRQSLENIRAILLSVDADMENIVKTTVLLKDINDFTEMNEVYAEFFTGIYPARVAYEVSCLPKDARVEIEAVAVL